MARRRDRYVESSLNLADVRLFQTDLAVTTFGPSTRYPLPDALEVSDDPPQDVRDAYVAHGETVAQLWLAATYRSEKARLSPPVASCLGRFVRLAEATSEEAVARRVLAFAEQWGVLGICCHWRPFLHNPVWRSTSPFEELEPCRPLSQPFAVVPTGQAWEDLPWPVRTWEPLTRWQYLALTARDVLLACAKPVGNAEPSMMQGAVPASRFPLADVPARHPPRLTREEVAQFGSAWLSNAGLVPQVVWDADDGRMRAELRLPEPGSWEARYGSLFTVLAVQLVTAICSPHGPYQCSSCGDFFAPERKPRADSTRHYCWSCLRSGTGPKRLYAERRRARERAKAATQAV